MNRTDRVHVKVVIHHERAPLACANGLTRRLEPRLASSAPTRSQLSKLPFVLVALLPAGLSRAQFIEDRTVGTVVAPARCDREVVATLGAQPILRRPRPRCDRPADARCPSHARWRS